MNVGDEVGDLLFEEMELFLNLIQGVFIIAVADTFVIVVRPLIYINTMRFLRLGIIGSTTRRAVSMARPMPVPMPLGSELGFLFDEGFDRVLRFSNPTG